MKKPVTAMTLVMINIAAIGSLNNLPSLATAGLSSVSYYLIAVLLFFVPYSLISAELSSSFSEESGIYIWVKEAFGPQWGFIAIWLQWLENLFWYPTILSFVAASLCYFFDPSLAINKTYNLIATLSVYWVLTAANLFGIRISNLISLIGSSIGILIPGFLLIVAGLVWYCKGHATSLNLHWHAMIPKVHDIENLAFLVGIAQTLAGLEMSAVHTRYVKNPQRVFPWATLISTIAVFVLSVLGSLAIAIMVPAHLIDMNNGVAQAFFVFLEAHHLTYLGGVIVLLLAVGGMTAASAWISGPSSGLLQAAKDDCLPKMFKQTNAENVSVPVLVLQGVLVSLFCCAFVLMPTVGSAYWLLTAIAGQLYLAMYILMFAAAYKLRSKRCYIYRIKGVKTTRSICIFGAISCLLLIGVGFMPPASLKHVSDIYYIAQTAAFVSMLVLPVIIYRFSKIQLAQPQKAPIMERLVFEE